VCRTTLCVRLSRRSSSRTTRASSSEPPGGIRWLTAGVQAMLRRQGVGEGPTVTDFKFFRDFGRIQWGPTLSLLAVRTVAAGSVWYVVFLVFGGETVDPFSFLIAWTMIAFGDPYHPYRRSGHRRCRLRHRGAAGAVVHDAALFDARRRRSDRLRAGSKVAGARDCGSFERLCQRIRTKAP
jgi:hypothetical protein